MLEGRGEGEGGRGEGAGVGIPECILCGEAAARLNN